MESATCCGMESSRSDAWNQSEGEYTLMRDAIRLRRFLHTNTSDWIKKHAYACFFWQLAFRCANIRFLFAWKASFPIFEKRMRTNAPLWGAWSILMLHRPIQRAHLEGGLFVLAGVAGIEPTLRESKSLAIPLGDTPLYLTYAL